MEKLSKYFSINLVAFISGFLLMLFLSKSSNNFNIKELQQKNDSLMTENKALSMSTDSLKNNIERSNLIIDSINKNDEELRQKLVKLNNKINYLKYDYEKANNHANNFNSMDIQRYFSELK